MLNKKYILGGTFILSIILILSFTTPYTPPTYNDINFSLCTGYTVPTYNDINFTLGDSDDCITDTCTYSGSGDWNITMSDYCILETDTNITTNKLIFFGAGNVTINATIDIGNMDQPENNGIVFIGSNAKINIG